MKKNTLLFKLALLVCLAGLFVSLNPASAVTRRNFINVNHSSRLQGVQPFCKFTFVDHRGHSLRLSTNVLHATHKSLTFIFAGGERLVFNFTMIRPGHFVAESARSKDPQILFYPSHSSHAVPMVGAVIISATKPISGNFSHLVSDDHDHLTLVSGTFTF
jgi:hypothetical protein